MATEPPMAPAAADDRRPRRGLSLRRVWAVLAKEFLQLRRDRLTFAMMIGVPVMQLVLFGFAINMDPKGLPAAIVATESSPFTRSLARALENTGYFRFVAQPAGITSTNCTSPRASMRSACGSVGSATTRK